QTVDTAVVGFGDAAIHDFDGIYDVEARPQFVVDDAAARAGEVASWLADAVAAAPATASGVKSALAGLSSGVIARVRDGLGIAWRGGMADVADAGFGRYDQLGDPVQVQSAFAGLQTFGGDWLPVPTTTAT